MHSDRGRAPGYGDLLAALLALRPDTATARFDEVLATLVAEQRLDPEAARELRWWQRESLRAIGDFLGETAPGLLADLETSQLSAHATTAVAAAAWDEATRAVAPTSAADLRPGDERETPDEEPDPASDGDDVCGARTEGGSTEVDRPAADASPASAATPPGVVVDLRTSAGGPSAGAPPPPPSAMDTAGTAGVDVAPPVRSASPTLASGRQRLLLRAPTLSDPPGGT